MTLQWLADYLNEVDVHDLPSEAIQHFRRATGRPLGDEYDLAQDMDEDELAAFEAWAEDHDSLEDYFRYEMDDAPPWMHFTSAEVVGPTWALHFTDARRFDRIRIGVDARSLSITKSGYVESREVDCDDVNLEYPDTFMFAFQCPISHANFRAAKRKYGRNAVLFRTDEAVLAYHHGDQEWQLIVPVCGEYHAVWLEDPSPDDVAVNCETADGYSVDCHFESVEDVIAALDSGDAVTEDGSEIDMMVPNGRPFCTKGTRR